MHDVVLVDTGYIRPGLAACYLVIDDGQVAVVDTGVNRSLEFIEQALRARGLGFDAVRWVMPTHVHLDHAGGAGALMRVCQNAQLVVHERGAAHMVDPSRLQAGVIAVYGQARFDELYGDLIPVEEARLVAVAERACFALGGSELLCVSTPGHASHHFCVWDATSRTLFSGDTFGLSYREFDVAGKASIFPTTTPVQFKPDLWSQSLDWIDSLQAERVALTHFGFVDDVARLSGELRAQLAAYQDVALSQQGSENRLAAIARGLTKLMHAQLDQAGCPLDQAARESLLALDLELNAKGLDVWLQRIG